MRLFKSCKEREVNRVRYPHLVERGRRERVEMKKERFKSLSVSYSEEKQEAKKFLISKHIKLKIIN